MNFINKDNFNKLLYIYATLALLLPNIVLCITERLSLWASATNIILPLGIYMLLMSLCKKTGKMIWICFIMIFFAAFQLVLLYLSGKGVIAVDMFLNLVTTNPGEAMELLDSFGQTTLIHFSRLERNPALPAATFRFVPPAGVDVVGE